MSALGTMKYSNGDLDAGSGMPARIQKNMAPKSFSAFAPTLQVLVPGTKVFTWMCTNFVPARLLQRMSVLGVLPMVTRAA